VLQSQIHIQAHSKTNSAARRTLCWTQEATHNPRTNPHPTKERIPQRGTWGNPKRLIGDSSAGDPPDPIPNSEVKPRSADGTAGATRWESTSSPIDLHRKTRQHLASPQREPDQLGGPFSFLPTLRY